MPMEPYTTTPAGISISHDGYPELLAVHNIKGGQLSTFCVQKLSTMENFLTSQEVLQWPVHSYRTKDGTMKKCTRYKMCGNCSAQRQLLLAKLEWKRSVEAGQIPDTFGTQLKPSSSVQTDSAMEIFLTSKEKGSWPIHHYKTKNGTKLKCTEKKKCRKCILAREQVIAKLQKRHGQGQQPSVEQLLLNQKRQHWPRHYYRLSDGLTYICTATQLCEACASKRKSPLDLINEKIYKQMKKKDKINRRQNKHCKPDGLPEQSEITPSLLDSIFRQSLENSLGQNRDTAITVEQSANEHPKYQSDGDTISHRNSKSVTLRSSPPHAVLSANTVVTETETSKCRNKAAVEYAHGQQQSTEHQFNNTSTLYPRPQKDNLFSKTSPTRLLDSACITKTIAPTASKEAINKIRDVDLAGENDIISNNERDEVASDVGAADWIISMDEDFVYYFDGEKVKVVPNKQNGKGKNADNTQRHEVVHESLAERIQSGESSTRVDNGCKESHINQTEMDVSNPEKLDSLQSSVKRCEGGNLRHVQLSSECLDVKVVLHDIFETLPSHPITHTLRQMTSSPIDLNPKVVLDCSRTSRSAFVSRKQDVVKNDMNVEIDEIEEIEEDYCNYERTSDAETARERSLRKLKCKQSLNLIRKKRKLRKERQLKELFKKISVYKQVSGVEESTSGGSIKTEPDVDPNVVLPNTAKNPEHRDSSASLNSSEIKTLAT